MKDEFEAKATRRLIGTVSNWKKEWKKKGELAKPSSMESAVWEGLVRYWSDPRSIVRADNCSRSRLHDPDGHGPTKHSSGQTSFAAKRLQLVIFQFLININY